MQGQAFQEVALVDVGLDDDFLRLQIRLHIDAESILKISRQVEIIGLLENRFCGFEIVNAVEGEAADFFPFVEGDEVPTLLEQLQCERFAKVSFGLVGVIIPFVVHFDFEVSLQGFHQWLQMLDASRNGFKLDALAQIEVCRKPVVDGKAVQQPHLEVVAEHLLTLALGNVVGIAAFVTFDVDAKHVGDVLAVVVERAFGDGVVVAVARPSFVQFLQGDARVAAISDGVGNPDAFDEFVHGG